MQGHDDLDAVMQAYAVQGTELIEQGLGHAPNFTPDSVVLAEAMAGCIHIDLPQDFVDHERGLDPWSKDGDAELQAVCLMLGGYVGEVIRLTAGGRWIMDEPAPALPPTQMIQVFPRLALDPVGWARRRILIGPEHNIFAAYEAAMREDNLANYRD